MPEHDPPQLLWMRLDEKARGGPARSLAYDQIARAAIAIADVEGIDAISMRRIAAELGKGTMSLYRYVASKDELLQLMYDGVLRELVPDPAPSTPPTDWREHLTDVARRTRATIHRHPWASDALLGRPGLGPNTLNAIEYAMAGLDDLEISVDEALDMFTLVVQYATTHAREELADAEEARRTGMDEQAFREASVPYVRKLLAAGAHPHFEAIVRDAEDFPDPDVVFERRLGKILDGLAANLPRGRRRHRPSPQRSARST